MSATSPLISYLIVTMNRTESVRQALESIVAQDYPNKEIIVLDNASDDGTAAMVEQEFPDVTLLKQMRNLGVAGGRNVAMAKATGDYLISIDDDVTLESRELSTAVVNTFAADDSLAAVSFHLLDAETKASDPRMVPRRDKIMPTRDVATGYFLGGACALRRAVIEPVGDYWERLNPYGGEEFDLSYRLLEAGYTMRWMSELTAIHHESELARPSGRKVYALTRNYPLVALRHLPWRYVISQTVLWWGYALKLAIKEGTLLSWLRGVGASCAAVPHALNQRRVISSRTIEVLKLTSGPRWY